MIDADAKNRLADGIAKLFDGMSLTDVSEVVMVQVASLAAQAGATRSGALDYLDDFYDGVTDMLDNADFEDDAAATGRSTSAN